MKEYWPMAVYIDTNKGKDRKLFTYDSCLTLEDAYKQFDIWENAYDYALTVEFVKVCDGDETEIIEITNSGNPLEQYRMADLL